MMEGELDNETPIAIENQHKDVDTQGNLVGVHTGKCMIRWKQIVLEEGNVLGMLSKGRDQMEIEVDTREKGEGVHTGKCLISWNQLVLEDGNILGMLSNERGQMGIDHIQCYMPSYSNRRGEMRIRQVQCYIQRFPNLRLLRADEEDENSSTTTLVSLEEHERVIDVGRVFEDEPMTTDIDSSFIPGYTMETLIQACCGTNELILDNLPDQTEASYGFRF
jgi:hypothetical protein